MCASVGQHQRWSTKCNISQDMLFGKAAWANGKRNRTLNICYRLPSLVVSCAHPSTYVSRGLPILDVVCAHCSVIIKRELLGLPLIYTQQSTIVNRCLQTSPLASTQWLADIGLGHPVSRSCTQWSTNVRSCFL